MISNNPLLESNDAKEQERLPVMTWIGLTSDIDNSAEWVIGQHGVKAKLVSQAVLQLWLNISLSPVASTHKWKWWKHNVSVAWRRGKCDASTKTDHYNIWYFNDVCYTPSLGSLFWLCDYSTWLNSSTQNLGNFLTF